MKDENDIRHLQDKLQDVLSQMSSLKQQAPQLTTGGGLSFFWGFILASLLAAFVYYRLKTTFRRAVLRTKQRAAAEAFAKLDSKELSQILRGVDLPSWASSPDFERVIWLNTILSQIFPFASRYASTWSNENVDTLLRENKPNWIRSIRMTRFSLGNTPPRITAVKVFSPDESRLEEILMEFDLQWNGDQEVGIVVQPLPQINWNFPLLQLIPVDSIIDKIWGLVAVKCSAEHLTMKARVRVWLKPLMAAPPFLGSAQIAFTQMPTFNFDLTVFGGNVSILPGLETWLYSLIEDSLFRPYCMPDKIVIPLISDEHIAADRPKGFLNIEVLEANHVPRMDFPIIGTSDPYVKFFVRAKRHVQTQTLMRTLSPKWNEQLALVVHSPEHQKLTAVMYDYDVVGKDDEIGRVEVPIKDLQPGQTVDAWYDVHPADYKRKKVKEGSFIKGDTSKGPVTSSKKAVGRVLTGSQSSKLQGGSKNNKGCRLHLKLTYLELPDDAALGAFKHRRDGSFTTTDITATSGSASNGASSSSSNNTVSAINGISPELSNMMRGGLLTVRVKRIYDLGFEKKKAIVGGWSHKIKAKVLFNGDSKDLAAITGKKESYNFDDEVEFVVNGDVASRQLPITIEVWDVHWKNSLLGTCEIPFKSVKKDLLLHDTFDVQGQRRAKAEVVCEWLGMMEAQ